MTNKIIEAAREARIGVLDQKFGFVVYGDVSFKDLSAFYAIARAEALEDAAQACRPFGKTGAVVAAAIKALKEQQHG